ncbi:MAG: hypothetical protein K2O41_04355 [Clostridia bacterium]|nr:hypothetical protein [Clostridia bacterium]
MKRTGYKISLMTLILALVISLGALLGINLAGGKNLSANAAGTVTVSGSNVFTATGDANVIADKQTLPPVEEGGEATDVYYSMFTFASDNDTVSYRKNLAYNWYEAGKTTEEGATPETVHGLFNITIGFKNTAFEKFIIKFESQVYEKKVKETKSANYVVFYPVAGEADKVYAVITDDIEKASAPQDTAAKKLDIDEITIQFTEKLGGGKYTVSVGKGETVVEGEFVNVGGNYAKSSTSTSNPVYPLSFKAEFAELAEGETRTAAQMVLYSMNGQSFELNGSTPNYNQEKDYYYGGTVKDDTAPVLCLEEELNYLTLGKEIDVDYAVIDVLRTSPRATLYYYVLTVDQYKEEAGYDYNNKEIFTEIKSSDTFLLESNKDKYYPSAEAADLDKYKEDNKLTVDMAAKVYFKLTDVTNNPETSEVYLDWYVSDEYKLNIKDADFIAVAKDEQGVTYAYDGEDGRSWKKDGKVKEYQDKIDELAANLSAGSSTYLYLPSVEDLFADNATAYPDLKISVYYYNKTQQSNTSLSTNNLSINVTQQGKYFFTFYATDTAGNPMWYLNKDGEVEEFNSSDVWKMFNDKDEEGLYDLLPWFSFDAGYTGVQFEETPGMQATAYVGTNYSSASFKINGISGSYSTVYRLYLFDRAGYYNDTKTTLSYEKFVEEIDSLYDNAATRKYFKEIPALADMEETDAEYEQFKDYEWNKTSTSFTPQDSNAFYLIRAEVTDNQYNTDPAACNLGVVASVQAKTLKGESDWLKKNVASVVLLCIAGIALICIVLLLVIKPKNEGDVDETYEKVKKNKKQ